MAIENDKPVGRREFFSAGFQQIRSGAAGFLESMIEKRMTRRYLRPPGAAGELEFLSLCTHCDDCVEACPHNAIVKLSPSAGAAGMTPTLNPLKTPCQLCADVPCSTVCSVGALKPVAAADVKIASIRFNRSDCHAWNATPCDYCYKWCPKSGDAIRLDDLRRPIFNDDACSGCGVCLKECPAKPSPLSLTPV